MPATNAPAHLGSLAASLGATRVHDALHGALFPEMGGHETLIDSRSHALQRSFTPRRDDCRFDHAPRWQTEPVADVALGELLRAAPGGAAATLSVAGDAFVTELSCAACGERAPLWRLHGQLSAQARVCPGCGALRQIAGFALADAVSLERIPPAMRARTLRELGGRTGDVFRVSAGGETRHTELVGEDAPAGPVDVVLAGLGNIGSVLASLLARQPGARRIALIDHDFYEAGQTRTQQIAHADIGRAKVHAQADRLRAIDPSLDVIAHVARLESLPFSAFRARVVVSALDSRLARMQLAERAWRMGSPFVDTAVDAPSGLARTNVWIPGEGQPCLECSFEPGDYEALEQTLPCDTGSEETLR